MKGIIFNLLESFVCESWGEDAYDEIVSMCPLHTKEPFVGPGSYPDSDLLSIVRAATNKLGITIDQALHAFGKYAFPHLVRKFPVFVEGHYHPKTFLKTIDDVIHVEVRKFFRDAEPPRITFVDPGPDELMLIYESRRRMCSLATGLLEGCAEFFRAPIDYHETQCMKSGSPTCHFHLTFAAAAAA